MSPPLQKLEELFEFDIGIIEEANDIGAVVRKKLPGERSDPEDKTAKVISFEDHYKEKTGLPLSYHKIMGDVRSGIPKGTNPLVAYMIEEIAHYTLIIQKRLQDIKWWQSVIERNDIGDYAAIVRFTDRSNGSFEYSSYIDENKNGSFQFCSTMGKSSNDILKYTLMQLPTNWKVHGLQSDHRKRSESSDVISVAHEFLTTPEYSPFVDKSVKEYCGKKCPAREQCHVGASVQENPIFYY